MGNIPAASRWPAATHLMAVLSVLAAVLLTVRLTRFDQRLADAVFTLEGGAWNFRNHPLLELGLHQGGRWMVILLALGLLTTLLLSLRIRALMHRRRALGCLLISMAMATSLIAALKSLTPDVCPWGLARYGGHLASAVVNAATGSAGHCFPSGHAGAGYCLFGLYFVADRYAPAWRWQALAIPLAMGLTFGITQQLRGAHFLSHDLWSAALCWAIAWGTARLLLDNGGSMGNTHPSQPT